MPGTRRSVDAQGTLEDMQATMNELPGLRGSRFLADAVAAARARTTR